MTSRSLRRSLLGGAAFAWLLLGASLASAHDGGTTGLARVSVDRDRVDYQLLLAQWPATLPDPARDPRGLVDALSAHLSIRADGQPCPPSAGRATPPAAHQANLAIELSFRCGRPVHELTVRDDTFELLGNGHHTIARVEWPGGDAQFAFQPDRREARFEITGAATDREARPGGGFTSFLALGIEHILTGWDHLLFLLALMLGGGRWQALLVIVTAFTVAHSVSLALAVLGVVAPPAWVEIAIAASIAWVAAENLWSRGKPRHRVVSTSIFGLVHGFGFAGAITELSLPRTDLALVLFGFNLGVEIGQAMVVALLAWPLLALARSARAVPVSRTLSAAVLLVGMALIVARV